MNEIVSNYMRTDVDDVRWSKARRAIMESRCGVAVDEAATGRDDVLQVIRALYRTEDRVEEWMAYDLPVIGGVSANTLYETLNEEDATRVLKKVIMSMP